MNQYSLVYLGPFERVPFFGGAFWFDIGVPQTLRGDLAAQLLFTKKADGSQQFQLASEADFNGMLFDGFIAAGTPSDGLVWGSGSRAVEQSLVPPGGVNDPAQATAAILGDALPDDETAIATDEAVNGDVAADTSTDGAGDSAPATPRTGRRARNTGAQA